MSAERNIGGAHGLGLAVSQFLAETGANVAIVDNMHDALDEIVTPENIIIAYKGHVDTVKGLNTTVKKIVSQLGKVDIWVYSEARAINNEQPLIKALIPYMHQHHSIIVNFVSVKNTKHLLHMNPLMVDLARKHHIGLHMVQA